jgi:hypothetical protein
MATTFPQRIEGEIRMDEGALASLTAILWQERRQLERLLYTLTTQRLLLAGGHTRWLGRADADIEAAASTLRDSEVLRAMEMNVICEKLGVHADITLEELALAAGEPWTTALTDHRTALRGLTVEIDAAVTENRRLLKAGAKAIGDTLASLTTFSATYDSHGGAVRRGDGPTFLDEQA